ncbi:MAG: outer membrane lipid asymmetry maintenance protein MlaD [Polynucleobacter sp.]|jgi:phospholipid/cholesterol/gamma-HCH transport system substrate-binding protein|uniref:outer membrane lipid asymmetry maintenance protein MlaD n=1 Tax=Polynucleobacter sp. TaxID=2029855 RepID=UPI002725EA81|nr:outer membrane lipid asymmetry maintenance protein MlaD [Polynucleobacter sp.]MCM0029125.1 outer membrane lipid asymmetry maintenance protein MlaD [Polynucleobacter sp.]MDO9014711.1 outer membrane lipid asymmetry maintenance protein MlaD [Polynucleobacter sp.]MDP3122913.1 outer membrane lipid asymmetry maintenance protein MlaD [Polynucleobacter sp.]
MRKSAIDVWVGIFVAIGLLAALFLALKVGNMNAVSFQPTYTITARFDNIGGLKPRAPVKSAGVVVGRIADIRFDDTTYQATVTMTLERSYQFPKDSSAKILTSGLLGEQYVGLEAGGSDQMLAQGNMITQTQSAVVLENLISQFLYNKAADGGKDEGAKK